MAYTVLLPKGDLLPRILTGLVTVPAVIFLIFQDPIYFKILGVFATFGLLREWSRLSFGESYHWMNSICLLAILVAFVPVLHMGSIAIILAGCGWLYYLNIFRMKKFTIVSTGYVYISLAMSIIIHIMPKIGGSYFILLVLALVWCVDTGAFLVGKIIGGPKLAPSISPGKTWAGFLGGIFFGLTGVWLLTKVMSLKVSNSFWIFCTAAVFLAHGGDLLESWCKRYFKVKDSGSFLPGHGGLLDRLDSLLAVSFAAALLWYFCG
jgi:phosphatidate cytidylyltransferase